jgi:hypothetical protein
MPIIEKWVEGDCVCVVFQDARVEKLICGYVGVDAEHPLYRVGYEQQSPCLAKAIEESKKIRKRTEVKSLLKGRGNPEWQFEMAAFDSTPSGYFLKCPIDFSESGNAMNLKEFNCKDLWFFGFNTCHPNFEGWPHVNLVGEIHRMCQELAMELSIMKSFEKVVE